jgi:hypothetical protein
MTAERTHLLAADPAAVGRNTKAQQPVENELEHRAENTHPCPEIIVLSSVLCDPCSVLTQFSNRPLAIGLLP